MNGGVPIARIAGIRIRAHWSVLVIASLLTWTLGASIVPAALPDTPRVLAWAAGAGAALLLIASLTAHELSHSLLARRRGVPVEDITLWLFGGVAHIRGDWGSARSEMLIAAAGPAVTLLIGAACFGISVGFDALGAPPLLVLLAQWLAGVNGVLLVFNLIPAFPLDGGRILRGVLWSWRRDRAWATITAARTGRVFAFLIVALGIVDFLLTGDLGGLWLVLIGWFLDSAAKAEQRGEIARLRLQGVRVGDVMSANPLVVPSWITVNLLIEQYAMRKNYTTFPTNGLDGRVDGLVTLTGMKRVPPNMRAHRRGTDIMIPLAQLPVVRPDDLVTDVIQRVGVHSEGHALVFDGDHLVGIIGPRDIARRLQLGQQPRRAVSPAPSLPPTG